MNQSQFTVTNAAQVLIFSGTGKVSVVCFGGGVYLGNSAVTSADGQPTGASFGHPPPLMLEFSAPTDVWAISHPSSTDVRVLHWY